MLRTPIYDIRGGRAYCGPTAISAVTGEPISIIREVIRTKIGTKKNGHAMPVIGISNKTMLYTMETLGWHVVSFKDARALEGKGITRLDDFLNMVQLGYVNGPHIVEVTGHYYAVDDDEICDTHTRIPIEIHRFKRGRQRWVKSWWKFEKADT